VSRSDLRYEFLRSRRGSGVVINGRLFSSPSDVLHMAARPAIVHSVSGSPQSAIHDSAFVSRVNRARGERRSRHRVAVAFPSEI